MDYLTIEPDGESRTSFEFDSAILLDTMSPVNEEKEIVIGGERRFLQFTLDNYDTVYAKWREKSTDNVEVVVRLKENFYRMVVNLSEASIIFALFVLQFVQIRTPIVLYFFHLV